jgi:hypothetical protein
MAGRAPIGGGREAAWRDEAAAELTRNPDIDPTVAAPPPGPEIASGFSSFPKQQGREVRNAQSRAVDKLLEKHLGDEGRCVAIPVFMPVFSDEATHLTGKSSRSLPEIAGRKGRTRKSRSRFAVSPRPL